MTGNTPPKKTPEKSPVKTTDDSDTAKDNNGKKSPEKPKTPKGGATPFSQYEVSPGNRFSNDDQSHGQRGSEFGYARHYSQYERPPDFLKDKTEFKLYKIEVERWERLISVAPRHRGDMIMASISKQHSLQKSLNQKIGKKMVNT